MAKGFNRPAGASGGQGGMMAQIQRLQKQMEEAQAQLAEETVTASAGGGAIKLDWRKNGQATQFHNGVDEYTYGKYMWRTLDAAASWAPTLQSRP